jgi:N-acetylglucosamine-6-phosphate deacetylase
MAVRVLRKGTVVLPEGMQAGVDIRIDGDLIDRVGRDVPCGGAAISDMSGMLVAPGFIDLHVHGAAGAMCEHADIAGIERISTTLAHCGVTGFLATVATLPAAQLQAAVEAIAAVSGSEPGARILGIHLEGPYLSPWRAGAQVGRWMRAPSIEAVDALQDRCGGRIRLLTVAPELDGALPFIAAVRERGVTVAIGHSNATSDEALLGIEAGATHVTHLFNAMRPLHHRDPGIIGVALSEDAISVELICDGHHLAPRIVDLAMRCKPPGKAVLVSDAVGALGMPDGDCELFGVACTIANGTVRVKHSGNLAGSRSGLDCALRNLRGWRPEVPADSLLRTASSAPAAVIGATDTGAIAEGRRADLVVLDPDLDVVETICGGVTVWTRGTRCR